MHGPAERDFSYIIGSKALSDALAEFQEDKKTKFQRLVIDYSFGEDPDDAYSSVPYEKGSNFLLYLERKLGGLDVFLPYARDYVHTFRGRSIRTDEWKNHLYEYFEKHGGEEKLKLLNSVDWHVRLVSFCLSKFVSLTFIVNIGMVERGRVRSPFTPLTRDGLCAHQDCFLAAGKGRVRYDPSGKGICPCLQVGRVAQK